MEYDDSALRKYTLIISGILLAIIFASTLSNILAFIIFSRKKFHNTIFSTYFRVLLLYDQFSYLIRIDVLSRIFHWYNFRSVSIHSCKFIVFLAFLSPSNSPWILVLISIDRMLSIVWPNRFLIRKIVKYQVYGCITVFVINVCFYFRVTFQTDFSSHINTFNSSNNSYKNMNCNEPDMTVYDLFYTTIIPSLIMLISTIITLRYIFESRKNINNNSSIKSKDIKFAFTSITLNVLHFVVNFPIGLFYVLQNFIKINKDMDEFISNILRIPFYVYFGSLFYSTLIVNSLFRKEFYLFLNEIKNFKCFNFNK